jgi:hypothetical protein
MDICDNGHEEIVYSRYCPLCRALREIDDLNSFTDELREQNEELRKQLENK